MTARTDEAIQLLGDLADAAGTLGLEASVVDDALVVDGARLGLRLVARAHPTPADLNQVVADGAGRLPALVVADRISDAGRDVLRRAGWGWLDRRGHLRLWAPGVRVESPLPDAGTGGGRSSSTNPWTTVGLEIALAALCQPAEPVTARRVAPMIGRSVGATHELIARFVEVGLVGPKTHLPLLPELFWEASAHWPDDGWVGLPVDLVDVAAKVGADELLRVDERAATLGGAHIAAAADLPARCYVRSASALRRARSLADRDRDRAERERGERGQAPRCWVRAAPISWLPENEDHRPDDAHPWHVAHPLVCALRLAADPARGREMVEAWGIVPGGS